MIKLSPVVDISIFACFSLMFFILSQGLSFSAIFISAILIHELSHIALLLYFKTPVTKISIYPFGIDILANTSYLSYKKELAVTLAGSLSNLLCAAVGAVFLSRYTSLHLLFFVMCHLCLGLFNLIPLSLLDGGRALELIMFDCLEINVAMRLHRYTDLVSLLIISAACVLLLDLSGFNLSVIMLAAYGLTAALCLLNTKRSRQRSAP